MNNESINLNKTNFIFPKNKESFTLDKVKISKISKDDLAPTGIQKFDKLAGGGFRKNSTNVIVGGPGSAKTIFSTEFLIGGMKKGEKCLYITFEEDKEQFYKNMLNFGWDLSKYEEKGLFYFVRYNPQKVKSMLEEGGGLIENYIKTKKISRLVIDSISSFSSLFENESIKRQACLGLFEYLRRSKCTSLLTVENDPIRDSDSKAIEFSADSVTRLYFILNNFERERLLEILKIRGNTHSNKIHKFLISDKGININ